MSEPTKSATRFPIRLLGVLAIAVLSAAASGAAVWLLTRPPPVALPAAPRVIYQCPMHPSVTSDRPGTCPICGMNLVKVEPASGAAATGGGSPIAFYRSPMDPKLTSPVPRKDEMGMDYLPVHADELDGGEGAKVKGLATIMIDPARQQLIGLKTAPVTRGPVGEQWRTVGRVEVDPTRVRKTNVKVEGYVERIFVDFVGRPVRRGEPLFSLYSPSLLAAQSEFLLALKTRDALTQGGSLVDNGESLVESARRKLQLWDVPAAEIERLERTRETSKTLTFVSPISGVVTMKNVVEGARLVPGDAPYEITDLGMVWVMADAYETDLGRVKVDQLATLTLGAYPGRTFHGTVAFIDPLLDAKSRTLKVHLHFPNPTGELKPELFGEVTLQGVEREGLRAPADAVVHAGRRDVVFLSLGEGKFAPREVKLGARIGADIEVLEGLEEGQQLVTRANFLVDSESQLRSTLSTLGGQ